MYTQKQIEHAKPNDGYRYLAVPYTHPDPRVRRMRYTTVLLVAARLMKKGYVIFSPITHTVPIEDLLGNESHEFWMRQDLAVLEHASELIVLRLEGWKESKGVQEEIVFAREHNIPISYVDYTDV